jgi:hypothetical protein
MAHRLADPTIDEQSPDEDERQARLLLMSQPPAAVEQDGRLLSACRLPIDPLGQVLMFSMNIVGATGLSIPQGKADCRKAAPVITELVFLVAAAMKRRPPEKQS